MVKKKYRVRWAQVAARDLEEIISYIVQDSLARAQKILARLKARAASLETFPMRGRLVPELSQSDLRSWRELVIKPYRLNYRVESSTVYVLALLDSRRNLEDILLERLIRTNTSENF